MGFWNDDIERENYYKINELGFDKEKIEEEIKQFSNTEKIGYLREIQNTIDNIGGDINKITGKLNKELDNYKKNPELGGKIMNLYNIKIDDLIKNMRDEKCIDRITTLHLNNIIEKMEIEIKDRNNSKIFDELIEEYEGKFIHDILINFYNKCARKILNAEIYRFWRHLTDITIQLSDFEHWLQKKIRYYITLETFGYQKKSEDEEKETKDEKQETQRNKIRKYLKNNYPEFGNGFTGNLTEIATDIVEYCYPDLVKRSRKKKIKSIRIELVNMQSGRISSEITDEN